MRATKSAVKRYALERLYLAGWSLPLGSSHGRGVSAFRTESGGPRLRFGFSHRAPRVEALFPLDHGRIAVQSEGSEVEFRKLLLTPIKRSAP